MTCWQGETKTTGPFLSLKSPQPPTFYCATFWNFSQPRPPKNGGFMRCGALIIWAPCYISLCHDAFHSLKMLPSTWNSRAEGSSWHWSRLKGFWGWLSGLPIWQTLQRPLWPQYEQSGEACLQGPQNALSGLGRREISRGWGAGRLRAYRENPTLPACSR